MERPSGLSEAGGRPTSPSISVTRGWAHWRVPGVIMDVPVPMSLYVPKCRPLLCTYVAKAA